MTKTSTTKFRSKMASFKAKVARNPDQPIAVMDRNVTVFMVVSPEYIEGLEATVDLLCDPQAMAALADSAEDIKAGRLVPHGKVRKMVALK